MSNIIVKNLGKKYEIFPKPKDRLLEWLSFGKKTFHRDFWALKDISFELGQGRTLGVIGPNGAGKSTLLKIVTGTTYPTEGEVNVQGKISSLLELGAGFHGEFTGRENIYMNASILGLTRKEIDKKFDEILDFSGLAAFIDQPLKTYSSGMFMRLGFSVAVNVDPDILIVDEVLAVGDQQFQKKCIDKINNFRNANKTILFCSHMMPLIRSICDEVIWLHEGKIVHQGDPISTTDEYLNFMREKQSSDNDEPHTINMDFPYLTEIKLVKGKDTLQTGEDFLLDVSYKIPEGFQETVHIVLSLVRNDNVRVFSTSTIGRLILKKSGTVRLKIPNLPLLSGDYICHLFIADKTKIHVFDKRRNAIEFSVSHPGMELGIVDFPHSWELEQTN